MAEWVADDNCAPALDQAFEKSHGDELFCAAHWDEEVCWPPTLANHTKTLPCPVKPFLDPTKRVPRLCDINGTWEAVAGWEECFAVPPMFNNTSDEDLEFFRRMAVSSRILAIVGYCVSWLSLLLALCIFLHFRSLSCNRTKIHKHFFVAFLIRLTVEIVLVIDQHTSHDGSTGYSENALRFQPVLCEVLHVFLEYGRFSAFAWMFIEGMYLNSLVSIFVFGKPKFLIYYLIGWVVPVPFVSAWAIAMTIKFGTQRSCWFQQAMTTYYLGLIEIPRNVLLSINAIFLINIVRILVTKLRESNSRETQQIRKAVKAAIILLPLLGIVNLFWILPQPKPGDSREAIIMYLCVCRFFDVFQGFFIAMVYCFLNQEVRNLLRRKWSTWRNDPSRRRTSVLTSTSDIHTQRSTKQRFEYITVTV